MKRAKNEKTIKKLTTIIFCLVAIILIIVAFVGVYLPKHNQLVNIIPDYTLGSDLYGIMEYRFSPDDSEEEKKVYIDKDGNIKGEVVESTDTENTEEVALTDEVNYDIETKIIKANEEKVLVKENFEKVKKIIIERLKRAGATDFAVRMNTITGDMVVELSRNDDIKFLYDSALALRGEFKIVDAQTGVILLDNSHIENAYSNIMQTSETGYTICLQIEFTQEGEKIFKNICEKYIEYTTAEGQTKTDIINITLDDMTLLSTYFPKNFNESTFNIPLSSELTDNDEINKYAKKVTAYADSINLGKLPVKYADESQLFIKTVVQDEILSIVLVIMNVSLIVALIIFTIKFKMSGLIAGILNAGFIALVTIILRVLEVVISISSLMALLVSVGLNIIFMYIYLLNQKDDESFLETIKKYYFIVMPVIIISFIFTFFVSESISGIGNVLFWTLLVQLIYNILITRFAINDK